MICLPCCLTAYPRAAAVEDRIAAWTMLPAENGEGLQVLRYENTQKYDAHWVSGLSFSRVSCESQR
jgi:hypothetical protein